MTKPDMLQSLFDCLFDISFLGPFCFLLLFLSLLQELLRLLLANFKYTVQYFVCGIHEISLTLELKL